MSGAGDIVLFYCGGDPPTTNWWQTVGDRKFCKKPSKEPAQKRITGTVKGELEAQDKGGPRSQETKTVKDCD